MRRAQWISDMNTGRWAVIASLLAILALALWAAYREWTYVDVDVPAWAWIAMAFGAALSVAVGGGLMALIFYSSRKGYDERANTFEKRDHDG